MRDASEKPRKTVPYTLSVEYREMLARSVEEARAYHGMAPLTFTNRRCLRCDVEFQSAGPQNRLCQFCGEYGAARSYMAESKLHRG